MTLTELLGSKFRGDLQYRGAAYLEAERVAVTRVTPDHIFAVVRDGVEHQTQLSRHDDGLKMYCSCASGSASEPSCKHLWATILTIDKEGFITGSLKPGYVSPFIVPSETARPLAARLLEENDCKDDLAGDVFHPPEGSHSVDVQPRLEPWESKLQELRPL